MKEITRCKDCPNWRESTVLANHCIVFDWCSSANDGCTFESEDEDKMDGAE